MKTTHKFLALFSLIALLTVAIATPVMAFDGRGGDVVVIEADEVIEDDLYVGAESFTLEGTVKGDLYVAGSTIVINGTVEGDLVAAGQSVVINGAVTDDARIAGAGLQLGKDATIGDDLIAAGASLETRAGSVVEGELVYGGGQALLAGNVTGDVMVGSGALELVGEFGGDITAEVGEKTEGGPSPSMYMSNTGISVPNVQPGLTIDEDAKIKGDLTYTQTVDVEIPGGVVGGEVTRNEPVVDKRVVVTPPTAGELAVTWVLDLFRSIVTLILFGLLLAWLAPSFIKTLTDKVQAQPAASLGWGVVAYAAFFFALLVLLVAMIVGAVVFGFITLGGVSGTIVWVGLLLMFAGILGFVLVTAFLTKIVVAWLGGKWILGRFNPSLAEHKFWPLVLGAVIIALLIKLPIIGWLIGLVVMFLGLGALWLWGRERWQMRKTPVA